MSTDSLAKVIDHLSIGLKPDFRTGVTIGASARVRRYLGAPADGRCDHLVRTPLALAARLVFGDLRIPPDRGMNRREHLALTAEILVSYAQLLRLLRRKDLPTMVGRARQARIALPAPHDDAALRAAVGRLGRAADRVIGVLPKDGRCLITSLVVIRVLARRSVDAKVVIGVRNEDGFAAHAWVEFDGSAVLPAGDYHRLVEV